MEPGTSAAEGSIPLSVPDVGQLEAAYAAECVASGWLAVGLFVERLEQACADLTGARHAVATTNGTAALHLALLLAGVRPDDEVIVPTLTFIASANAVVYAGATPALLDVEPDHWQLDPERVEAFLAGECERVDGQLVDRRTGRRVSAVMPVHILGHPVDLDPILALAEEYGLAIVEDATESIGARYRDRPVGGLGLLGCLSFNGNKLATAGGGGMILTDDDGLAERARYLSTQAKDDPVEYVHNEIGFNYRLSNLHAAIGCAQLERLDELVAARRAIAARYAEAFAGVDGFELQPEAEWASSTFWLSTVLLDPERLGVNRHDVLAALAQRGIQSRPLWQPLHLSPAHASARITPCPVAESIAAQALSLPSSSGLTRDDQERVIAAVIGAVGA